jgi:hypothetical protein
LEPELVSRPPERQPGTVVTRRRFLAGGTALVVGGGATAVAGCGSSERAAGRVIPAVALGDQPAGLPSRQFAWTETLSRDADGNPVAPRYDRLLMFDVNGRPGADHARLLEAALRTLERRYRWAPRGLLFSAAWGVPYFTRVLQRPSPIPAARGLSDFELPAIDSYDLCLHLAGDDEPRLAEIERALVHGERLPGADGPLDVSSVLTWRETRTGFTGPGLPAAHQRVGGIPAEAPVPPAAPLYMGFKSNLKRNQASEDAIAIASGPFAGGTTMAVSYMRLRLDSWYGELTHAERVARMYAPQVSVAQAARFTTDAESDPKRLTQAVDRYGVIGHAQTSARARRHGKPLILRRDFDTTDGGQAGLHFVSLQRDIADFVRTRTAMNAASAQLRNPAITDTVNNGINAFIFVVRRGNYIVPSRGQRSFPLIET